VSHLINGAANGTDISAELPDSILYATALSTRFLPVNAFVSSFGSVS